MLAASATLALLIGAGATPASAACDPGIRAIQYLASNQKADGSLDMSSAGGGNPGATMDFAMDAAANAIDPGALRTPGGSTMYDYLATQAPTVAGDSGQTAKLLLALVAGNTPLGKFNYHGFGGQDLLGKLTSPAPAGFYHDTGASLGAYGSGATFAQSLAIMAVRATGGTPPPAAISWLKGLENQGSSPDTQSTGFSGKGWSTSATSNASQGDTNSTAIALEALSSVGDSTSNAAALAWLHTQQSTDAGFSFQVPCTYPGCSSSDPNSDAFVLQALTATGQNLAAWTTGGQTPRSNLLTFQDAATGGFSSPSPDTFTTSLAVPAALAGRAMPVASVTIAGATVPAAGCAVATAGTGALTATPTASPSPAPRLPAAGSLPEPLSPTSPVVWAAFAALVAAQSAAIAIARLRE